VKMIEHYINVYEDYSIGSFYYDRKTADKMAKIVREDKKLKRKACHKVMIPANIALLKKKQEKQ
jgi:hypothetical protein